MESLKAHRRSRVGGHLQILQILLVLLVLLDLAEETLSEYLWFLLDLFEPLKGRILKSFSLKLIWFFKRMISNSCCQNVEGAIRVGVGFGLFKRMVSSRVFPRLREPEVVELLEDLNLSVGVNSGIRGQKFRLRKCSVFDSDKDASITTVVR